MPETLYRVSALCGLAVSKDAITAALTEHQQTCIGVPSATEGIATAARMYMEEVLNGGDVDAAAELLMRAIIARWL
jgi:hypothetical protein